MKVELNGEEWSVVIECVDRVRKARQDGGLTGHAEDMDTLIAEMSDQLKSQE